MAWLIVSIGEGREWMRVDTAEGDTRTELCLSAASRAVTRYLKGNASVVLSIDSPPDSPPNDLSDIYEDVKLATLLLSQIFYDDERDQFTDLGQLPKPVTALLYPLRDPTMA
jgi:hypothetical protein